MTLRLMLRGLRRGKARFLCAVLGIAAAVGAVVFTFSLTATNAAQAPALAKRATAPWAAWRFDWGEGGRRGRADLSLEVVGTTIDLRPGGRVLQGPPMRAVVARAPAENPYGCTKLVEGRWVDPAATNLELVCTRNTLVRFGRGVPPPVGTDIKFVGEKGTLTAKVVGYLAEAKLPMGWPGVFANPAAFAVLRDETHGTAAFWKKVPEPAPDDLLTAESETVVRAFVGARGRRTDCEQRGADRGDCGVGRRVKARACHSNAAPATRAEPSSPTHAGSFVQTAEPAASDAGTSRIR